MKRLMIGKSIVGENKTLLLALILILALSLFAKTSLAPTQISERDDKPVQVLFVGDVMLDREVRSTIASQGFEALFSGVRNIFENLDLGIGNLEGTITANPSIASHDYSKLKFTFDPSVSKSLKTLGFTAFSLANNHALDFGPDGFSDTEKNLTQAGLSFFGSPLNNQNLSIQINIHDEKICLVGFHSLYDPDYSRVVAEINKIKPACTFIVVFAHWGEEYQTTQNGAQTEAAHAFVDAGADLVIGAHPHVIEPVEIYKGKAIFYSLGNFVFDQDFSSATEQGLAVRLELGTSTETFHLIGIQIDHTILSFSEKETFQPRTDILTSKLPPDLAKNVDVDGVFTLPR